MVFFFLSFFLFLFNPIKNKSRKTFWIQKQELSLFYFVRAAIHYFYFSKVEQRSNRFDLYTNLSSMGMSQGFQEYLDGCSAFYDILF